MKTTEAKVGALVVFSALVLCLTVYFLGSARFGRSRTPYLMYLKYAGGLEPGATVRYAGGPKVGRVEKLQLDPKDSSHIEITFSVKAGLPVKTDSHVRIMSLSPLGDNHLELVPGSEKAALAAEEGRKVVQVSALGEGEHHRASSRIDAGPDQHFAVGFGLQDDVGRRLLQLDRRSELGVLRDDVRLVLGEQRLEGDGLDDVRRRQPRKARLTKRAACKARGWRLHAEAVTIRRSRSAA